MRASERIKCLEEKLEIRTDELVVARKEAKHFKQCFEQLNNLPTIHSASLIVPCQYVEFEIYVGKCTFLASFLSVLYV